MSHAADCGPVKRRHVFFLSGFDPKGASYYHRLYRTQASLQGALTGTRYEVSDRRTCDNGNAAWTVRSGETETVYEYVRWDDIVRAHWPRGAWQVLTNSLRVYALLLKMPRMLRKVWQVASRTLVSLFYPVAFWLGVGLLSLLAALCAASGVQAWAGLGWGLGFEAWGALLTGGLASGAVLAAGWQLEKRLHTSWLLRIYRFADRHATGQVPELSARLDGLAVQIRQALLTPGLDEVLLVGFSVGSMGAVAAAARTAHLCASSPHALSKLSVLTLGHCIPLFALMPAGRVFRAELALAGANRELFWVDSSSPSDWGSFAMVDPVPLCAEVAPDWGSTCNPRAMTSPRFHTLFDHRTYAEIKKDKRRMHMQYLMAGELSGAYDYFLLTAGAVSLRRRYLQKASS